MLLAGGMDIPDFAIYVLILAVVAIVSLVRKAFEKASSGQKGKKIDLGKSVHAQLKRYMEAMDPSRREAPPASPAEAPVSRPPAVPAATRLPPPAPQAAAPAAESERPGPATSISRRRLPHLRKPKWELDLETKEKRRRARRPAEIKAALTGKELRHAVLLAEILGPPVSERQDYRLF